MPIGDSQDGFFYPTLTLMMDSYYSSRIRVKVLEYLWQILYNYNMGLLNNYQEGIRPPDKSVYWKITFFISHPKHILWILKRTVSMRRFF